MGSLNLIDDLYVNIVNNLFMDNTTRIANI